MKSIAECEDCRAYILKKNLVGATEAAPDMSKANEKNRASLSDRSDRLPDLDLEFGMLISTRERSIAIALALGLVFAAPLSARAFAGAPQPQAAAQSPAITSLRSGDLVRVRSGGPLMTVTAVQGGQIKCSWTDWVTGELRSETFPVAVLGPPMTAPPDNLNDEGRPSG